MRNETTVCDVCTRAKVETNDWLIAITSADSPGAVAFAPARIPFDPPDDVVVEDICGADCAHKRLSRALNTQPEMKEAS